MERAAPVLPGDDPMSGHGRQACVSLEVDDADAYYNEWKHKVEMKRPPMDEYWGGRTFDVHDPAGNTLFVIWARGLLNVGAYGVSPHSS